MNTSRTYHVRGNKAVLRGRSFIDFNNLSAIEVTYLGSYTEIKQGN